MRSFRLFLFFITIVLVSPFVKADLMAVSVDNVNVERKRDGNLVKMQTENIGCEFTSSAFFYLRWDNSVATVGVVLNETGNVIPLCESEPAPHNHEVFLPFHVKKVEVVGWPQKSMMLSREKN